MASTPTRDLQEEFLAATRKSQETVVRAIKTWVETVRTVTPKLPSVYAPLADRLPKLPSVTDRLPKPEDVVASSYDFAEHLLALQRQFAEDLLKVTEPLIARNGQSHVPAAKSEAKAAPATPPRTEFRRVAGTSEPKAPAAESQPKAPAAESQPKAPAAETAPKGVVAETAPKTVAVPTAPKAPAVKFEPAAPAVKAEPGAPAVNSVPKPHEAAAPKAPTSAAPKAAPAAAAPKAPEDGSPEDRGPEDRSPEGPGRQECA